MAALLVASPLRAQEAATVPASSELYDRLESVTALYPVRGGFLGERPLSRRAIRTIVDRLTRALQQAPAGARRDWARRELEVLVASLATPSASPRDSGLTPMLAWRGDVQQSDARAERIAGNGLGEIAALANPFDVGAHGAVTPNGRSLAFTQTLGVASGARWRWAVVAQPRFAAVEPIGVTRHTAWAGSLDRAYARVVARNIALRVGAEEARWGQSPEHALFISGNAGALPALELSTDTAIVLPWWFRYAGAVRATLQLADLGARQDPPHAKLAAWQVSIMPASRFELGVAVMNHTGGSGGPKASFFERVVDLFPVIDALAPQHADLQISNKLAGGNLRLRVPEWSGLDVYYELQIDDFDGRRLRSSLVDDAAHLVGFRLPLLTSRGQLAVRAEWMRTGIRLYEHAQFRSGVTYRERLIGNPLGPHAAGASARVAWEPSPLAGIELGIAEDRRDPSRYATVSDDALDRGFRFVRLTDDPDVRRVRVKLAGRRETRFGGVRVAIGHAVVWRPGGPSRREWGGRLVLDSRRLTTF